MCDPLCGCEKYAHARTHAHAHWMTSSCLRVFVSPCCMSCFYFISFPFVLFYFVVCLFLFFLYSILLYCIVLYCILHWRRKRGWGGGLVNGGGGFGQGGMCPPTFLLGGGCNGMFVLPPHTLLTPHFYFPLELYVYITLANNYLAFFLYQLIMLWTISIN